VSDIRAFAILTELLPERVGSEFSLNSLREDLSKAYATVVSWYAVLESLYYCFTIRPYSKRIARSLRVEPKVYLYDLLQIPVEREAQRLENLTALHLLKACHFWTDTAQGEFLLYYVRNKEKREVDFLVVRDQRPWMLLECKSGQKDPAPALKYYGEILKPEFKIQLVKESGYEKFFPAFDTRIISYQRDQGVSSTRISILPSALRRFRK
jgi:predicted AAA+ superfamily ATPase